MHFLAYYAATSKENIAPQVLGWCPYYHYLPGLRVIWRGQLSTPYIERLSPYSRDEITAGRGGSVSVVCT